MIYGSGFRKKNSKVIHWYGEFESLDKGEGLYNKDGSNVSLIYSGDSVPNNYFIETSFLKIIFGKKIKFINNYTFRKCSNLTQVSLPNVTSIGYYTFFGCSNLTQISLPNATSIGDNTFYGCSKLKKITCKQGMRSRIQQLIQESNLTQPIEIIEV